METTVTRKGFLGVELVSTIVADIFSLMTIKKLQVKVSNIIQPESQNNTCSTFTSTTAGTIRHSTKLRQRKATVTLSLILLFINLSISPTIIVYVLIYKDVIYTISQT